MACARAPCSANTLFILINIAFAMYAGALLCTAARLAWDPSTYAWFRYLCAAQYRVSSAYVLAAGLWLAALAALGAATAGASASASASASAGARRLYCGGVAALALSQLAYGAWMAASLARWWRVAPQAEVARRGMDALHDLKPALLAVERYRDLARPLYDMIEEVEREAPNNAIVVVAFGALGALLQVAAFVLAHRLAVPSPAPAAAASPLAPRKRCTCAAAEPDAGSDSDSPPPHWRKAANLRMYTILDKIF